MKVTTKLGFDFTIRHTISEFCDCMKEGKDAMVIVNNEQNVNVEVNQADGSFEALPINPFDGWSFDYVVVCKSDICPNCPGYASNVEEFEGTFEGNLMHGVNLELDCDDLEPDDEPEIPETCSLLTP